MTNSINLTILDELKVLMEDDFSFLIETYINDSDERIRALEDSISSCNSEQIREIAHSFKGSSANLGAQPLADKCFKLELMGRESSLSGVEDAFSELKAEYQEVRAFMSSQI